MSAFLTSKKDLSTIAFCWGKFFNETKKESFTELIYKWRQSDGISNERTKDIVAKFMEDNLEIEPIIFSFLLDANISSLRTRYEDQRKKTNKEIMIEWEGEVINYEDPQISQISTLELMDLIGSYTSQASQDPDYFNRSSGFQVCKMIMQEIKPELKPQKHSYAAIAERQYKEREKEIEKEIEKPIQADNGVDVFL